ncbi:MAG: DUF4190 domain-containing protein [Actinotalea sp.]|nr:DUF4190 domain-containing protein [Actinotalea sp.]
MSGQGTSWTPADDPPPAPPWEVAGPPAPWPAAGSSPPAPWEVAGAPAPEVRTTGSTAPDAHRDPFAGIDPFRTDGVGIVPPPPARPGAQYRLDAPPGAWGPPPEWTPPPRTNPLAVTALVVGILGLLVFPLVLSPVALVLGIVGVLQVRRTGEQGTGLAVAGIVLGAVGTLVSLALVALFASLSWWGG